MPDENCSQNGNVANSTHQHNNCPMKLTGGQVRERRSLLEKILLCLVFFLFLVIIVILVYFILFSSPKKEAAAAGVCLSENCVRAAGAILSKVDTSVDPCEDFYRYSCGTWIKETVPPEKAISWDAFAQLVDESQTKARYILDEWEKRNSSELLDSQLKTLNYFQSCLGENNMREQLKGQPFIDYIAPFRMSHTMFRDAEDAINITEADRAFSRHTVFSFLYSIGISPLPSNASVNILNIGPPKGSLVFRQLQTYRNMTPETERALTHYITHAYLLLADTMQLTVDDELRERIREKATGVIAFERDLANIMSGFSELSEMPLEDQFLITTLGELQQTVPEVDFLGSMQESFDWVGVEIGPEEPVRLHDPRYFDNLSSVLRQSDPEAVVNTMFWLLLHNSMGQLSDEFSDLRDNFTAATRAGSPPMPRRQECLRRLNEEKPLGEVLGAEFIDKYFSLHPDRVIPEMIEDIKSAFIENLNQLDWIDEETRRRAELKVNLMDNKHAYPIKLTNSSYVDQILSDVWFDSDQWFHNQIVMNNYTVTRLMRQLRQPVNRDKWEMSPQQVNAYYEPSSNSIRLPGGILQSPFYSERHPDPFNYGGIGVVIGHEITHGFDTMGSKYDEHGNQIEWINNETLVNFDRMSQCFVDQYNQYVVHGKHSDGLMTLGENIADNGGLKFAFRAYEKHVKKHGEPDKLPGLELDGRQMFFLAFGQLWCTIQSAEHAHYKMSMAEHSLGKVRVRGAVSNLPDFAQAFHCVPGAPMNPVNKCTLW